MTKKPSLDEYKNFGIEMKFLGDRLTALAVEVSNSIGVSKKEGKDLIKLSDTFSKCKSNLEELMFSQYGNLAECTTGIFYGERGLPSDLQYKPKEGEDIEPMRDSRGLIVLPEMFKNFSTFDNSYVLSCPICGYTYCSFEGREEGIEKYSGECGHVFGFSSDIHKGETLIKVVRFPDKEEQAV